MREKRAVKWLCRFGVFVLIFFLTYYALCFLVPGWKLKLAAGPAEYFWASVRHMASLKFILSAAVGLLAAWLIGRFLKK